MYQVKMTKTFRKDTERCRKRGYDMELLKTAIRLLEAEGNCLPLIVLPSCRVTMLVAGNVTLRGIG